MAKGKIHIGASGWHYEHWKQVFYPEKMQPKDYLPFYAQHFSTTEINNTFYHLPKDSVIDHWVEQVPAKFIFSLKASGYITHRKRLKDPQKTLKTFFERMEHFGKKIGVILFQLPPNFKCDLERLENFLNHLQKGYRYSFEFRHPTWFTEETYRLLRKHNIALCISDLIPETFFLEVTAKFIYIRMHGPKLEAYRGAYGPTLLKEWKAKIEHWSQQNITVYCYFDNDEKSFAVKDAKTLLDLLKIK